MFVGSPARPLFDSADLAVVVATAEADALTGLRQARSWLGDATSNLRVVTVGGHPYGPRESAAFLQLSVFVVASDARAAEAMAGRRRARSLQRSSLVRSVRSLIGDLLDPRPVPGPKAASIPSPVAP